MTLERLEALKGSADALTTLLADRTSAKGAGMSTTDVEHEAAARQRDLWSSSYRLLS